MTSDESGTGFKVTAERAYCACPPPAPLRRQLKGDRNGHDIAPGPPPQNVFVCTGCGREVPANEPSVPRTTG